MAKKQTEQESYTILEQLAELITLAAADGADAILKQIQAGKRPRQLKPLIESAVRLHQSRPATYRAKVTRKANKFAAGIRTERKARGL